MGFAVFNTTYGCADNAIQGRRVRFALTTSHMYSMMRNDYIGGGANVLLPNLRFSVFQRRGALTSHEPKIDRSGGNVFFPVNILFTFASVLTRTIKG